MFVSIVSLILSINVNDPPPPLFAMAMAWHSFRENCILHLRRLCLRLCLCKSHRPQPRHDTLMAIAGELEKEAVSPFDKLDTRQRGRQQG